MGSEIVDKLKTIDYPVQSSLRCNFDLFVDALDCTV